MRLSEIVVVFSNDDISFKTFCNKQLSSVIKQFHGKITEKVHKSKMHKLIAWAKGERGTYKSATEKLLMDTNFTFRSRKSFSN